MTKNFDSLIHLLTMKNKTNKWGFYLRSIASVTNVLGFIEHE